MNHRFACGEGPHPDPKQPLESGDRANDQELVPDPPPVAGARTRLRRGFAAMDRKAVSEIARKGGQAAHSSGRAHQFTSDEARAAGRKGGLTTHAKRRDARRRETAQESAASPPDKEGK